MIYKIISNLVIFPLISLIAIVIINKLTLILEIIGQCLEFGHYFYGENKLQDKKYNNKLELMYWYM